MEAGRDGEGVPPRVEDFQGDPQSVVEDDVDPVVQGDPWSVVEEGASWCRLTGLTIPGRVSG